MAETVNPKIVKKSGEFTDSLRTHDVHQFLTNVKSLRPLGDTIILKTGGSGFKESVTKSGIFITEKSANPVQIAEVVAVSNGWFYKDKETKEKRFFEIDLKKGDRVVFYFFGATPLHIDTKTYLVSKYEHILGVVTE